MSTFSIEKPGSERQPLRGRRKVRTGVNSGALRLLDRSLAAGLFVLLAPLMAVVAVTTWVMSRRSPLVAHLRAGRHGRTFWMYKFRTMWAREEPDESEKGWTQRVVSRDVLEVKPKADPRVTSAFASWCRVYSVDELPQLWHVVRGEMSLVGPRPLTELELQKHYCDRAIDILSVPPGLTGLWQIRGRNTLSYAQRRRFDLFLVSRYSTGLYWRILLGTIPRVLSGRGAW